MRGDARMAHATIVASLRQLATALRLALLIVALPSCAVMQERQRPPKTTTHSEPLPPVRLARQERLRAEETADAKRITVVAVGACEQRTRHRTTTTTETEHVATQQWRQLLPLVAGVVGGIVSSAMAAPERPEDDGAACVGTCPIVRGTVLGVGGSMLAAVIDSGREGTTTSRHVDVTVSRIEQDCEPIALSLSTVLLHFEDGTTRPATTDKAGQLDLPPTASPLVAISVDGQ